LCIKGGVANRYFNMESGSLKKLSIV
jgi:hypothetical protein